MKKGLHPPAHPLFLPRQLEEAAFQEAERVPMQPVEVLRVAQRPMALQQKAEPFSSSIFCVKSIPKESQEA